METKKKKLVVEKQTEELIEVVETAIEEVVVSQPKEEFRVLKSFTVDKIYNVGDVVSLSDEGVIKELKINKYIK
jgi:hypothetical protein